MSGPAKSDDKSDKKNSESSSDSSDDELSQLEPEKLAANIMPKDRTKDKRKS